jgi:hypothetical protein
LEEKMATGTDRSQGNDGGSHSTVVRAAVAAAATGAAAYGVLKLRSNREEVDDEDAVERHAAPDVGEDSDAAGKREELTHALAAKVAGAKKATSRLKPNHSGRQSIVESAWSAASQQLLPVAQDAAAALGETVAKKVPDTIRDDLMPRFIEGFQKAN